MRHLYLPHRFLCGFEGIELPPPPFWNHSRVFSKVVGKYNETELKFHFAVRFETETPEVAIGLDASEHGLRSNGTVAAGYHSET